ncbi:hypothetical protein, partial [Burkholderia cenocepacia]|uniref:hypothetical protein n=1 Tax=Burkholderia cenocepacia TaxID=95486 RepID=UPI0038CBF830
STGTHVFDGWSPLLPMRGISHEQLRDAAAFALTLPEGSWLDLEPASHEQGWLGAVGPPYLRMLLDGSLRDGSTISIPADAASGTELLAIAERLTAEAAEALVGPSALELRTSDGMLVRTVTAPTPLPAALTQLGALVATVPGAE